MTAPLALSKSEESHAGSASGSSFYTAMRIMPPRKRAAMYEIYHFCRTVDDIADDIKGDAMERLTRLRQWRQDIEQLYAGNPLPQLRPLANAVDGFSLRKQDFLDVLDGMEMDVHGPIQAPTLTTLELYCDHVACAVGRLSVRVFNMGVQDGLNLAHHLGMALQLTNILRDIDEDGALGRLYLPRELLIVAGMAGHNPAKILADPAVMHACWILADKALIHFDAADDVMKQYASGSVRTPRIMSEAYRSILAALMERGFAYPRRPVRLSKVKLGSILMRNMFF